MNEVKRENYDIHKELKQSMDMYIENDNVPNILFYGPDGSGKKYLLNYLLDKIYPSKKTRNQYVLWVNCSYGKGIKFIREDLKFFAKTTYHGNLKLASSQRQQHAFKSIVLLNADKLTIDAQSALRRCIELYNHNTRFFIIVSNKYHVLLPILSRFMCLHVDLPVVNNKKTSLYLLDAKERSDTYRLNKIFTKLIDLDEFDKSDIYRMVIECHENSLHLFDVMEFIETKSNKLIRSSYMKHENQLFSILYNILVELDNIRIHIRNEKISIMILLSLYYIRFVQQLKILTKHNG